MAEPILYYLGAALAGYALWILAVLIELATTTHE